MFSTQLQQAGLSKNQALVYEALLKAGKVPARNLLSATPLKRGLLYKTLDELAALGIVIKKDEPAKVALFEPAHPSKLKEIAEEKEKQAQNAQIALNSVLGQLASEYSLISDKPGIRFYEGLEGIKTVLEDTLKNNPETERLVFSDAAGYATYLKDWNTKYYAPRRKQLNIRSKAIVPNHPKALEWLKDYKANDITQALLVDHALYPFSTEINIYNNHVSFVTFSEKTHVGVIIENKEIYETLKSVFYLVWELGKKYPAVPQPAWANPSAPVSRPQPKSLMA